MAVPAQALRGPVPDPHWPSPDLDLPDPLRALARLRADAPRRPGEVSLGRLRRAVESGIAPIACVQVGRHVPLGQRRRLDYATPRDVALTSHSPVVKGAAAREPTVARIAAEHGATPAQVALVHLLAMPGVAAIPKSASPARHRRSLGALPVRLDAGDLAALDAPPKDRRTVDPGSAPDWGA